jgi:hypothetical protein
LLREAVHRNLSDLKNLFYQIYSLMFVKDSKMVILFEKGQQYDAEEKKANKIKGLTKNLCFVDSFISTCAIGSDLC